VYQAGEVDIVKLSGGHIHRNRQRLRPTRRLAAGRTQTHSPICRIEPLSSAIGMKMPAICRHLSHASSAQRLEADNLARLDVLLGLITRFSSRREMAMPQIVFQQPAVAHFRAHLRLEEAVGAAAFHLGAVKRRVRMAEQTLRSVASFGQIAIPMLLETRAAVARAGVLRP